MLILPHHDKIIVGTDDKDGNTSIAVVRMDMVCDCGPKEIVGFDINKGFYDIFNPINQKALDDLIEQYDDDDKLFVLAMLRHLSLPILYQDKFLAWKNRGCTGTILDNSPIDLHMCKCMGNYNDRIVPGDEDE